MSKTGNWFLQMQENAEAMQEEEFLANYGEQYYWVYEDKQKEYITAITRGADGSSVVTAGKVIDTPAEKIDPIDTNGAGDMFAGSFMHAYLEGSNLSECSSFANVASSLVRGRKEMP